MMPMPSFHEFFTALWGLEPFPWQTMLAERIANDTWPRALDLPTASGKTACIDIAVWALADQADRRISQRTAPCRIWFVVDRRIVVDEAYERAVQIAETLNAATNGPLKAVADRLREVSGTDRPLAVARLRGGVLRNDGWALRPSQPAVITSTVDQYGSRLLFRGYGRSHLTAPIFAGLAAHDSLVLLDEAHCSVPFLQTLRAVQCFRGEGWAEQPIQTPFAFAVLTATPPPDIPLSSVFPGTERDRALDHPILKQRILASKPAELVVVRAKKDTTVDPLVTEAVKRAQSYLNDGRQRVAIVLNRVRTALEVKRALCRELGDPVDVVLLTGRLRPLERDRLVEKWKPFLRARNPKELEKPVVLVATQCIEVGADFSFDALVTEAASLDALLQRFGRLNRMGILQSSPATILISEEDAKEGANDAIYGTSIVACWQLLDRLAATGDGEKALKVVDFGINAIDDLLSNIEDLSPYLAPKPNAPVLLPAYLDLLCQTSPVPHPEPDIQLFLHGMGRGAPEAQIVWRADLDVTNTETWRETVALCPPVGTEALSVPLYSLREWLADSNNAADTSDVEGATAALEDDRQAHIRPVLVWAGRERSRLVRRATDIKPNDLVVVPASYGMLPVGQSVSEEGLGENQLDLWEPARLASGRQPAVRLHRAVFQRWLSCPPVRKLITLAEDPAWERSDLWAVLDEVLTYEPAEDVDSVAVPHWLSSLLSGVRYGRVEVHPGGGLVLFARRADVPQDTEPDLFADDDELLSAAGQPVSLAIHTESVKRAVQQIASRCVDDSFRSAFLMAAEWHDAGKLDGRFQVLLRQGDELAAVTGEALAKSADIPSSPSRRQAIREASGLPPDFRHEMLSLQLAEHNAPLTESEAECDLVLHLIASHHGYGRPFAPVSFDPAPPPVSGAIGNVTIELDGTDRAALGAPHALASEVSERFWSLTRKYGWWGLAYLEAIMRLGDWYGSRFVVNESAARSRGMSVTVMTPRKSTDDTTLLSGIDGSNPLGFLAALGTLSVLHMAGHRRVRLGWNLSATWQPVLSGLPTTDPKALAELVADALRGNDVSVEAERRRQEAQKRYEAAQRALKAKQAEIKKRGLRGKERSEIIKAEVEPIQQEVDRCRQERQLALRQAVPRPELAIGKHIDTTVEEYREHAAGFLAEAHCGNRESLGFLAAFASDACLHESANKRNRGLLAPTPFCFTTGSGHQSFLDTVRQLMAVITPERVQAALFRPWTYSDETLTLRWDPKDYRRYALMDRDPAVNNLSRTVWMANLLAYRALVLFPSVPTSSHLATTAWSQHGGEMTFTWPIWDTPVGFDTVRSLLLLPELAAFAPDHVTMRARGIVATFRARRIKVGSGTNYKWNFSPAKRV